LSSYSLYDENLKDFFNEKAGEGFNDLKKKAMSILQKEAELEEIVRLVGVESLSLADQFLLEVARIIREDFLHQNAFLEIDTYTSLNKQYQMIKAMMNVFDKGNVSIKNGKQISEILPNSLKDKLSKMKMIKEEDTEAFSVLNKEIEQVC